MSERITEVITDEALNSFDAVGASIRMVRKGFKKGFKPNSAIVVLNDEEYSKLPRRSNTKRNKVYPYFKYQRRLNRLVK